MTRSLSRDAALRMLMDFAVKAADEAMCPASAAQLRDAAARIHDARSTEQKLMTGALRERAMEEG